MECWGLDLSLWVPPHQVLNRIPDRIRILIPSQGVHRAARKELQPIPKPCASLSEFDESAGGESSEGVEMASTEGDADLAAGECVDACCPSIQATADGGWKLHIPLASVLTTIGGLFLIATHIGNLCRCACCEAEKAVA